MEAHRSVLVDLDGIQPVPATTTPKGVAFLWRNSRKTPALHFTSIRISLPQLRNRSFLVEDRVNQPATPSVFTRLPAVVEDVLVVAAGVFQGVGQDRRSKARSLCSTFSDPRRDHLPVLVQGAQFHRDVPGGKSLTPSFLPQDEAAVHRLPAFRRCLPDLAGLVDDLAFDLRHLFSMVGEMHTVPYSHS